MSGQIGGQMGGGGVKGVKGLLSNRMEALHEMFTLAFVDALQSNLVETSDTQISLLCSYIST